VAASERSLAAWCATRLGRSGVRIERELSGGNSNVTLLLGSDQGPMVLRAAPANTISPTAHKGVERESVVMSALAGRAPVPGVLAWCEDATVFGRPFLLLEHVDGISITDRLPEAYRAPGAVDRLGEQLVDALAAIAVVPWQQIGLATFGKPGNFLPRQVERWLEIRRQSAVRTLPLLEQLARWLLDNVPASGPVGVVHGDYHLDNTLCSRDEPRLLAVIDWEMATIGDPLTDLGLLLMFWGPRAVDPPGFARIQAVSRQPGAIGRRALAQRWASATGIDIDIGRLDYYLCFAFWRLAAVVEGAYVLYRQGKVDTPYARDLEHDVPALLEEARLASRGEW